MFVGEKVALLLSRIGVTEIFGKSIGVPVDCGVNDGPEITSVLFGVVAGAIVLSVTG